jgi:uncharacterized protein (TIRG00374 family)
LRPKKYTYRRLQKASFASGGSNKEGPIRECRKAQLSVFIQELKNQWQSLHLKINLCIDYIIVIAERVELSDQVELRASPRCEKWVELVLDIKNKRIWAVLLPLSISVVAIAAVLKYTSSGATLSAISKADVRFLILALILHILFWILWALRLWYLTSIVANKVSFGLALKATLASNFLSAVTPASAGGEPMRVKVLNDGGVSCGCGTAVIISERLLDSLFFVVALLALLAISDSAMGLGFEVGGLFLMIFILTLILLWQLLRRPDKIEKVMAWLRKRFHSGILGSAVDFLDREIWIFRIAALRLIGCAKNQIPAMLALTVLMWLLEFMIPSVLLMGLGQSPHYLDSLVAKLIIILVAGLPLTPGSSGVVELSMSYLYAAFVPDYLLGVLVLVWRTITYFTNLVVGAPFAGTSLRCK